MNEIGKYSKGKFDRDLPPSREVSNVEEVSWLVSHLHLHTGASVAKRALARRGNFQLIERTSSMRFIL
jgi:hypothetical protein